VALLVTGALAAGFPGVGPRVKWQTDLHAAHRVSVANDRPMLLVFGADWCGYCKKLEQKTLGRSPVAEFVNAAFVPVHIDFDRDPRIAEVLEIKSLPCTVVLSPEADLLGRLDGYVEHEEYKQVLEQALELRARIRRSEQR
jgi:uncharacterized protein YyaL (SSP411 family)